MTREELNNRYENMSLKELNFEMLEILDEMDHIEDESLEEELDIIREYIDKKS